MNKIYHYVVINARGKFRKKLLDKEKKQCYPYRNNQTWQTDDKE